MSPRLLLLGLWLSVGALGQEQVDRGDTAGKAGVKLSTISVRARVTRVSPEQKAVGIGWRHGGEGLGGEVVRGNFVAEDGAATVAVGQWSKAISLGEVAGKEGGWRFPTVVVSGPVVGKKAVALSGVVVEFEFAVGGRVIKTVTEGAPKGASVSLAVPAGAGDLKSFADDLVGVSEHARRRHGLLAKAFGGPGAMPKLFGVIGHLAGYGEGAGYGIRHSDPAVVKEECETLKLLGVNGLVGEKSVQLADAAGAGGEFRQVYWGGPGSGSPMNFVKKRAGEAEEACPYDPAIAAAMAKSVENAIAEHKRVGAKQSWGLWWDEIGVAAKGHLQTCPRCREKFVEYLKGQKVAAAEVGAANWEEVRPYPIWPDAKAGDKASALAKAPASAAEGLRYYYTYRFMTEATAQLFVEPAKRLKEAGVLLYAMQGPTPSWAGHSLDWHEFYDRGANTALVFETSNRDPRAWQWESYLAEIGRGICGRHGDMPMGVLVKPHRGAVEQRMLAVAARGARVIEWYTYGPDYAKGDSFSQSPELLERVARAARFLGANEEYLYGARPAVAARVAFCSPRSSEIWGKATELGVTAFEDAKWVYLALRHANVPVDVISEQQIAEGKLEQYKVVYVVGPNLRRDAAEQLKKWVEAGGTLWTDALGLSRDEANQPAYEGLTGLKERKYESWGSVEPYRATEVKPIVQGVVPADAFFVAADGRKVALAVGREVLQPSNAGGQVMRRRVGHGEVWVSGMWAGLTYSAGLRRADFDMSRDFDAELRGRIVAPTKELVLPVTTSSAVVEAIPLVREGRRAVALINWGYRRDGARGEALVPVKDLKVDLRRLDGVGQFRGVRSAKLGALTLTLDLTTDSVTLPRLDEIDLLVLE